MTANSVLVNTSMVLPVEDGIIDSLVIYGARIEVTMGIISATAATGSTP